MIERTGVTREERRVDAVYDLLQLLGTGERDSSIATIESVGSLG